MRRVVIHVERAVLECIPDLLQVIQWDCRVLVTKVKLRRATRFEIANPGGNSTAVERHRSGHTVDGAGSNKGCVATKAKSDDADFARG